jgi:hypothetical protein
MLAMSTAMLTGCNNDDNGDDGESTTAAEAVTTDAPVLIPPVNPTVTEQLVGRWTCTDASHSTHLWYCTLVFDDNGRFIDRDGDAGSFTVTGVTLTLAFDDERFDDHAFSFTLLGSTLSLARDGGEVAMLRRVNTDSGEDEPNIPDNPNNPDEDLGLVPELVGTWNWTTNGGTWYVLNADGTGSMRTPTGDGMSDIYWGTQGGSFLVCVTPDICDNAVSCVSPVRNEYTLEGDTLTLTSSAGRSYEYSRD